MKRSTPHALALFLAAVVFSGVAIAQQPAAPAASPAAAPAAKDKVQPHNHMRDAKGTWVGDKAPEAADGKGAADAKGSEAAASGSVKAKATKKKKADAHSHPRDGKGM